MRKSLGVSSPTPSLQLSVDSIAAHLHLPLSALLTLDQTIVENVLTQLFTQLSYPPIIELIDERREDRKDDQTSGKIGSSLASLYQHQSKTAEEKYRQTLANMVITRSVELGFKGIIPQGVTSLVQEKRLALRLIDFLTKKAITMQQQQQQQQQPVLGTRNITPHQQPPSPSNRTVHSSTSSTRPSSTKKKHLTAASNPESMATPPAATVTAKRDSNATPNVSHTPRISNRLSTRANAATTSNLQSSPTPAQPLPVPPPSGRMSPNEIHHPNDAELESNATSRNDFPPYDNVDDDYDSFVPDSSRSTVFDGRFADREFDPSSIPSNQRSRPSHRPHTSSSSSSSLHSARSTSSQSTSKSRRTPSSSSSSLSLDTMSVTELRAELAAERERHGETRQELDSLRSLYQQLLREQSSEKYSSRRCTLLKAQNMQLERQLAIVSEVIPAKRQTLNEMQTVVTQLEGMVRDEANASSSSTSDTTLQRAARNLGYIEAGLTMARERLEKYQRNEFQYSDAEYSYRRTGGGGNSGSNSRAPFQIDSIHSGLSSHLNLDRIHALESQLSEVYEALMKTHKVIALLSVEGPMRQQVDEIMQAVSSSPSPQTSQHLLQTLLHHLRQSTFELQSVGVSLPSSTNFLASSSPPWPWLQQLEELTKRRTSGGVGSNAILNEQIENILRRASLESTSHQLKLEMYETELDYYRRWNENLLVAVRQLIGSNQKLIAKFHTDNNALYAAASSELNQLIADWSRNSHNTNVQRLLTTLQSIFPTVKQLLQPTDVTHGPYGENNEYADGDRSNRPHGLPDIASHLEDSLHRTLEEFHRRLDRLHQEERDISSRLHNHESSSSSHGGTIERSRPPKVEKNRTKSQPKLTQRNDNELPPFQF